MGICNDVSHLTYTSGSDNLLRGIDAVSAAGAAVSATKLGGSASTGRHLGSGVAAPSAGQVGRGGTCWDGRESRELPYSGFISWENIFVISWICCGA